MSLPNYDSWKLASPPEYDTPDCCPQCSEQYEVDEARCRSCGHGEPEEPDDHDLACDSARDDAMEKP